MNIISELNSHFQKLLEDLGYNKDLAVVSFSARPEMCDFQLNSAFQIAKEKHCNPLEIAKQIAQKATCESFVVEAVAPAFVNIKLSDSKFNKIALELLLDENAGIDKHQNKKNYLIDYGGANVAKELHIGHLRSAIIGESLKRLFRLKGDSVVSDSHLGDWGTQMGLTIAQLEEDGHLDYYFGKSKTKPTITLEMLNEAYPKASKRKNTDVSFKKKADDYTLCVQKKKDPFFAIYKEIREVSVKKIAANYKTLGCEFDLWYGESDAEPYIAETVQMFVDKGLARKSEGALVVDVAREGEHIPIPKKNPDEPQLYKNPMPPCIIKKANEGEVYATTDLATLVMRNRMFHLDEIDYVVDSRQSTHFEQVFRCAKMSGISPENQTLLHIAYGKMLGKDGKPFKTRSGETVKLEDVIDLLRTAALERLEQNGIENDPNLALKIGVAAMKFGDLSNQISKDYVFDLDRFLAFEGKTGPFLQYTGARIKSLIAKAGKFERNINLFTTGQKEIVINILKLLSSYEICYTEKSLAPLTVAVYNLASSYSSLYASTKILTEVNTEKKNTLLSLSELVLKELTVALYVLGIEIPERM